MLSVTKDWNPKQALLRSIIQKEDRFDEAIELTLELHSRVHSSKISNIQTCTLEDAVWNELDEYTFRTRPSKKDVTIAWNMWHITRIEDITSNILILNDRQVISDDNWVKRMNSIATDTGNAMTAEEIIAFSSKINMEEFRNYRIAVGRKTRDTISKLKPGDLKRKMDPSSIQRILSEGGVLDVEGSRWLLDFWGRKNVAGILLMPITRHQVVHINDSLKLKEKIEKKKF